MDAGEQYDLLKCPGCLKINLRHLEWDELTVEALREGGRDPEELLGTVVYPIPPQIPEGLPQIVRRAYREALEVRDRSPNAYAVLLGRVLEIVCRDREASGETLYEQIADLGHRKELPETIVQVAHGVRKLRNVGAYAAIGSLSGDDVTVMERLARAVLEFVYTAPHLAKLAERER